MEIRKSIIVTGGAGYIGSHTCLSLLQNGYEIYVIDSLVNSYEISLKRVMNLYLLKGGKDNKVNFFKGDIRDINLLSSIFEIAKKKDTPIVGVVHLAGLKSASDSFSEIIDYFEFNLQGSIELIKVMDKFNCRNLVFSSSASVYSVDNKLPYKEEFKIQSSSPYGESKLTVENFLKYLSMDQSKNWKFIILRYFNPVSSHESGLIGEVPKYNKNNLFPNIYSVLQNRSQFLKIYGNDWPSDDGTQIRDFIHVMDIAEGHAKALDFLLNNDDKFNIVNLGSGDGRTVLQIIKYFEKANQCSIPIKFCKRRERDSFSSIADISYAENLMNWIPKRSLEDICQDGFNWIKKNPNGYF